MEILAAIPAYNAATSIHELLTRTFRTQALTKHEIHVLICDDGSTDNTEAIAREMGAAVIRHRDNEGYGAATRSIFNYARKHSFSHIITLDADLQHPPEHLIDFLTVDPSVDIVSGSRYLASFQSDTPAPFPDVNAFFTELINQLTSFKMKDVSCGFKRYSHRAFKSIVLCEPGYSAPLEFWLLANEKRLRFVEIPVPRIYHPNQNNFQTKFGTIENGIAYGLSTIIKVLHRERCSNPRSRFCNKCVETLLCGFAPIEAQFRNRLPVANVIEKTLNSLKKEPFK